MPKLSLRTFAAILLAACLMRALFPSLKAPVSAAFAKLTGIDRSPELLIETMGSDLYSGKTGFSPTGSKNAFVCKCSAIFPVKVVLPTPIIPAVIITIMAPLYFFVTKNILLQNIVE